MEKDRSFRISNDYTRLTGTTHDRSTNVPRLYLGPNHLLILKRGSVSEVARRFYYEDITALRCRPTRWSYFIDGAFVTAAVLLWLNYIFVPDAGVGSAVVAVATAVMAGLTLLTSWLRGPSCETWLHTANHAEKLTTLARYNTARRALGKLHERVAEAQTERFGDLVTNLRPFDPFTYTAELPEEQATRRHDARVMHVALLVTLFSVLLGTLDFFFGNDGKDALGLWTMVAAASLCIVAIVRSYDTDCPAQARRMCACLVASTTLSIPITLAAMVYLALNGVDAEELPPIRELRTSDGLLFVVIVGLHSGMLVFDAICAVTGLIALNRHRTQR